MRILIKDYKILKIHSYFLIVLLIMAGFATAPLRSGALESGSSGSSVIVETLNLDNIKIIVANAYNVKYSFKHCSINYIDLDPSDDYAFRGLQALGVGSAEADPLSLPELAEALRGLRDYTIWYWSERYGAEVPAVAIKRSHGVVEVLVKPGVDVEAAAREIAEALKDLMTSRGYTTLVVVRALSDLTPGQLEQAYRKISDTIMEAVLGMFADVPSYLARIAELQKRALEEGTGASYITVGLGVYGAVKIHLWGPKPSLGDLVELARWVRDASGVCDAPLYIVYHGPKPPIMEPLIGGGDDHAQAVQANNPHSPNSRADSPVTADTTATGAGATLALAALAVALGAVGGVLKLRSPRAA